MTKQEQNKMPHFQNISFPKHYHHTNLNQGNSIYVIAIVCFPDTFCRSGLCYFYNSLSWNLLRILRHMFFRIVICLHHINFHYMMIWCPFGRKDQIGTRNKLIWRIWWWQYVIYPSSILTCPLNTCIIFTILVITTMSKFQKSN